jgi:hypothetical protein
VARRLLSECDVDTDRRVGGNGFLVVGEGSCLLGTGHGQSFDREQDTMNRWRMMTGQLLAYRPSTGESASWNRGRVSVGIWGNGWTLMSDESSSWVWGYIHTKGEELRIGSMIG